MMTECSSFHPLGRAKLPLLILALITFAGNVAADDRTDKFCAHVKALDVGDVRYASAAQLDKSVTETRAALAAAPKDMHADIKLGLETYLHMAEFHKIEREIAQPSLTEEKKAALRAEQKKYREAFLAGGEEISKRAATTNANIEATCPGAVPALNASAASRTRGKNGNAAAPATPALALAAGASAKFRVNHHVKDCSSELSAKVVKAELRNL